MDATAFIASRNKAIGTSSSNPPMMSHDSAFLQSRMQAVGMLPAPPTQEQKDLNSFVSTNPLDSIRQNIGMPAASPISNNQPQQNDFKQFVGTDPMQAIRSNLNMPAPVQQPAPQPTGTMGNINSALDYLLSGENNGSSLANNPIARGVHNVTHAIGQVNPIPNLTQNIATQAMPNAPYIGQPGTNVRQDFMNSNPVQSTGNPTIDRINAGIGSFVGPFIGTKEGGAGAIQGAEQLTTRMAPSLGKKALQGAIAGSAIGGGMAAGAGENLKQIALNAAGGAALGSALDVAGSKVGEAFTKFLNRNKSVAPAVEQQTKQLFNDYGNQAGPAEPNKLVGDILQEASQRITPPLENPKLLDKYLTQHLGDIPKSEVSALSYNDKADLAKSIQDNISYHDVAQQIAKEKGYNWNDILNSASKPLDGKATVEPVTSIEPVVSKPEAPQAVQPEPQQAATMTAKPEVSGAKPNPNELKFSQTVRNSDQTVQDLKDLLTMEPPSGARTTDVLNRQNAAKMIEKNGVEGTYQKLLAKKGKFSPAEVTAAQVLAKQLSHQGDLEKAIELVTRTAQEGRQMGQAIQALSQWNKLDEQGALLLATRQINAGKSAEDMRSLTTQEAQPIKIAAQRLDQIEQAKSLAQQVTDMLANKKPNEPLSPEEKSLIQDFKKQVQTVDQQVKKFLPESKKPSHVIQEISKIEPAQRTRDNIVSFLDAKAELAKKRILASRSRLSSTPFDIYADYAVIGAAKLAKGVVKLSDFTESMIKEYGDSIRPHINQIYNKSVDMFRKSQGLPTITELNGAVNAAIKNNALDAETGAQFKGWAKEIQFYTDDNLRKEATQDLQLALKGLGTSTAGQKGSALQAGAQLIAVTTTERNYLGNEFQNVLEKINKMSAVPIDWTLSKLTGERTIIFNTNNQENYWKNFLQGAKYGWKGVSPNDKLSAYDIHPEVFKNNNPLKYVTKIVGAELQSFDHAAYMRAYGETLGTHATLIGRAKGLSGAEIKAQMPDLLRGLNEGIHQLADEAGRYATFQDDSLLASLAQKLKRGMNFPTDALARTLVKKGVLPENWSWEGIGLGDAILKYTKTPANIIMRAIDYSPIGIARGIGELLPLITHKEFNQRQAVLSVSRAITGTMGLSVLGYYLADAGILTGSYNSDKDIRSLQEQSGLGTYTANMSGLIRWLTSNFNKDEAKYQPGDKVINYAWIQPAAISLAMGVNYNVSQKNVKPGEVRTMTQNILSGLAGGGKSILEQPLVSGVQNVMNATNSLMKQGSWAGFANIFRGIPSSFVPSLARSARNLTDNKQRETYDPNALKYSLNLVLNSLPGASKTLPVSYDTLGNPRQRIQGGKENTAKQAFNAFINPAKVTTYQLTPNAKIVMDLINATGATKVAPRAVSKYLTVPDSTGHNHKVNLTTKQYSDLQKMTGQRTAEGIKNLQYMLQNPLVNDKTKVQAIYNMLNTVGKETRDKMKQEVAK